MSDEEDAIIATAACVIIASHYTRGPRRYWVRPSLKARDRYSGSDMIADLREDDVDPLSGELRCDGSVKNFLRMTSSDFEYLISMIGHKIKKRDTNYRKAVPVKEKLAVTLRFLATGDSYTSLGYLFKISKSTISLFVIEVCKALIEVLKDNIKLPETKEEWLHHASDWNNKWNFPHCIGCMDGKHVMLQAPIHSGCQGRLSDGGVYNNSTLKKLLEASKLDLPPSTCLPGRNLPIPYVLLADDAFALQKHVMKPYPGLHEKGSYERNFNYRHCRGRRVIENVFGVVSVVFRVLRKPLLLAPEHADKVVLACAHLHNFLRRSESSTSSYTPQGTFDYEDTSTGAIIPGQWRVESMPGDTLLRLKRVPKKPSHIAKEVRREFASYFKSKEGSVSWQDKY